MQSAVATERRDRLLTLLLMATLIALAVSGLQPYDRVTWAMEVAPVIIALPILFATRRNFPLTTLLYVLIFMHALVLILGGAYTYARVPVGGWVQQAFDLARNPYDKLGHFMQGFVPAMVAREILIRKYVAPWTLRAVPPSGSELSFGRSGGEAHALGRRMVAFLCICIALAISAVYELVEWWAALALGQGAEEFLGTQGDPWDTQSDMFCAGLGALFALLTLSAVHDRQLAALNR
jgi:putative membrane protein